MRTPCIIGKLSALPDAQKNYSLPGVPQTFRKRQIIFQTGSKPYGLYVVCSGRVKVYKNTPSGRLLTTRIASTGELLGYRAFFADETYAANAETLEDTSLRFLDREVVRKLILTQPPLVEEILRKVCLELRYSEDTQVELLYKPAHDRLRGLLVHLGKIYSSDLDQKEVVIPLTRDEIADLAGLTSETTIRLLREFQQQAIVGTSGYGRLTVHLQALRQEAA
ncbi:MAG: Crp/Fnr family transcriptional regulator [Nitrospirae bacterium]|nr:Crp/Fnr family transcriptional regulator [Nitrospirota bacterium]